MAPEEVVSLKGPKDHVLDSQASMGSQENGPGPGFHIGAKAKHAFLDGSEEPSGSLEGQHCHPSGQNVCQVAAAGRGWGWGSDLDRPGSALS